MPLPETIRIVEVGARDGLQNEKQTVEVATKTQLVNDLVAAGIEHIEVGSFVSPKWVPQMAASDEVFEQILRRSGVCYSALTPNMRGLESALECNPDEVAVFTAASDAFTQKNINCTVDESLERIKDVMSVAKKNDIKVRGYVSTVMGCPYQGDVKPEKVLEVAQKLLALGCYEISLGDTIGVGTPEKAAELIKLLKKHIPVSRLAVHFHDTYGQALANIYACLQQGISVVDSSVAGLGGCPYAAGASGNVATEDVVYMMQGLGIETCIDLAELSTVGQWISDELGRPNGSKTGRALLAKTNK